MVSVDVKHHVYFMPLVSAHGQHFLTEHHCLGLFIFGCVFLGFFFFVDRFNRNSGDSTSQLSITVWVYSSSFLDDYFNGNSGSLQ